MFEQILQLFESFGIDIITIINVPLIVVLLSIGFCVKHFVKKIPNQYIPTIIIISAICYNILYLDTYTIKIILKTIFNSFLTSAITILIHTQGKAIFKVLIKVINNKKTITDIVSKVDLDELLDALGKRNDNDKS